MTQDSCNFFYFNTFIFMSDVITPFHTSVDATTD